MRVLIIISALILHPIRMHKCLSHCLKTNHMYNVHVCNFNYDIWCNECGEVFSNEVK